MLSKVQMLAEIQRVNRLNADTTDYALVMQIYNRVTEGITLPVGTAGGGELFFRARVNPPSKPTQIAELEAPHAALVTGFQRCNSPNHPLFYTSSKRITALLECRIQPQDVVYLGQWMANERVPVNLILDVQKDEAFLGSLSEAECLLYAHLDTIFTRRIHQTFSNDYKFSAAVAELLTSHFQSGQNYIQDDGCVGIRYPSVFDLAGSRNTALPPEFARSRLELLHLMELKILARRGDEISVEVLDIATDFGEGNIHWMGCTAALPAPRTERGVLFQKRDDRLWVGTVDRLPTPINVTENLIDYLLKE